MKVFVLGGAGFIGSHLTYKLCLENYEVTIYDRNLNNKVLPECDFHKIEGNFLEENSFETKFESHDVIIHLISTVSPQSSMVRSLDAYCDVVNTLQMLDAARKSGIRKVVFLSSGGTVYGDNASEFLNEDMDCFPLNHYGIMKLSIEKILLLYNQLYDMDNVILRVANPYGPGQDPTKKVGAISVFLDNILRGNKITLFGDGSTIRDYIEIEDVCEAIISAMNYRTSNNNIQPVFNIGTGVGTSIQDLITKIETITNINALVEYKSRRSIDARRNVLDTRRSKEYLGFQYKTDIETGISNLFQYYSRYSVR